MGDLALPGPISFGNGNGNNGGYTVDKLDQMAGAVVEAIRRNGVDPGAIMSKHCNLAAGAPAEGFGCGCQNLSPINYVPWAPKEGACPSDVGRLLCWMWKGLCSFNKFGKIGSVTVRTEQPVNLPNLLQQEPFAVGPDADNTTLGVIFPREWVSEAVFHGIQRLKVTFGITNIQGDITHDQIKTGLFEELDFRVLQMGTDDAYSVALNIGEAADAMSSEFVPAYGGYFLPCGGEFVPFVFAPEMFAFDFRGIAPGDPATDSYSVSASVRTYWKEVC